MDNELVKELSELFDVKLQIVNEELKNIKIQLDENTTILKTLERNFHANKAEHDKIFNEITKLSGNIENMRKDLSAVEVISARNMENIAQFKIAK